MVFYISVVLERSFFCVLTGLLQLKDLLLGVGDALNEQEYIQNQNISEILSLEKHILALQVCSSSLTV